MRRHARLELKQLVGMAEVRDEEEIPIDDLLKKYPTDPGVVALYARTMQHRTNKVMDSLSNRLLDLVNKSDEAIAQVRAAGEAQGKQQKTMNRLTLVIAVATVAYTGTTIYATRATLAAQQAANRPQAQIVYVRGSGAVPESAAVHMGVDEKGNPAVCVNGTAYDIPASGDARLKERPQPSQSVGAVMPVLRCQN